MARSKGEAGAFTAFRALWNRNVAEVVGVLLLAVFLISHILWIVERKINSESFPEGYVRGVWESLSLPPLPLPPESTDESTGELRFALLLRRRVMFSCCCVGCCCCCCC